MPYPELTQTLYLLTGEVVTEPTSTIKNILTIENYTHTGTVFLVPQTNLNNKKRTNYLNSYEVFNSTGRRDNNLSVRDISLSSSYNEVVISGENKDVTAYARIKNKNIFAVKFSAPGGKRTDSVKNTDLESGEYSSNNNINFRNYEARYTQSIDLQQHTDLNYTSTYTTHKINKNHRYLVNSSDVIYSKSDNGYVSHQLPYHKDQISWAYKLYNNDAERRNHYVVNNIQTGSEFYITLSFDGTDLSQSFGSDYKLIYGNSSWTQVRASQNWKIRKLRQNSYFIRNSTETTQEGRGTRLDPLLLISSGSLDTSSEGKIIFKEPVVDFCPTYTQINYNDQYIIDNTLYNSKFYNDELNNKNNINQDQQEDVLDYFEGNNKVKIKKMQIFPDKKFSSLSKIRYRNKFIFRHYKKDYVTNQFGNIPNFESKRLASSNDYGYTIPSLRAFNLTGSVWPLDYWYFQGLAADQYTPTSSMYAMGELTFNNNFRNFSGVSKTQRSTSPIAQYLQLSQKGYNEIIWYDYFNNNGIFQGVPWTADFESNSRPFEDSEKIFCKDMISSYKNYSLIPEYNLSNKITSATFSNFFESLNKENNLFEITGSEYLNTNSDIFVFKNKLSLNINSVIKFRPYENFYPLFKSLQCVQQFSSTLSRIPELNNLSGSTLFNYINRFAECFFAPGILYNSIKAGLPEHSLYFTNSYLLNSVPIVGVGSYTVAEFENIFDPFSFLQRKAVGSYIFPTESSGIESKLYKNMINNFLQEIKTSFCKNNSLEYFVSKNENQFAPFISGTKYVMDVQIAPGKNSVKSNGIQTILEGVNHFDASPHIWTPQWESFITTPLPQSHSMIRMTFQPSSTRKYTIDEILSYINIEYRTTIAGNDGYTTRPVTAQTVDSSFNIFEKIQKSTEDFRWKISSKWEFPFLSWKSSSYKYNDDFTYLASANTEYVGGAGSPSWYGPSAGGLWHNFCDIPNSEEGIFITLSDLNYTSGSTTIQSASLADMVGFTKERKRIGELNEQKEISELICIVPVNKNNNSFIKIDQRFDLYKENEKYLKKYIFPPKFDYLINGTEPIAMFCQEITDIWSKTDLAYIWQNLLPQNGLNHKHKSEKYELNDPKVLSLLKNKEIYFMIFKCKLRSVTNPHGTYGYNWPYDDCSLVELVQIEAITEE